MSSLRPLLYKWAWPGVAQLGASRGVLPFPFPFLTLLYLPFLKPVLYLH